VKRNLGRTRPGDWEGFDALLHQMSPEEWQEGFAAFLAKRSPDYDPLWKKSW